MMACIFLEFVELGPFQNILLKQSTYFSYMDDVVLIYRDDTDLNAVVDKLIKVEYTIEFPYEMEENNT